MRLIFGVVDIPYAHEPAQIKKAKASIKRSRPLPKKTDLRETTGDVAEILEDRYHPMRIFYELHKAEIDKIVTEAMAGDLENRLMGAPPNMSAFDGANSLIESMFRQFLSNKEMEALGYPGVPTKAALDGVSHRFKHPYAKRPERPSFIDTGLYQASFAAEVKED